MAVEDMLPGLKAHINIGCVLGICLAVKKFMSFDQREEK